MGWISASAPDETRAGYPGAVVEIVDGVKQFVRLFKIFEGTIGQNPAHPGDERFPFVVAVRILEHDEAAARQIFAQILHLLVGKVPATRVLYIEPWPVEEVIRLGVDHMFF